MNTIPKVSIIVPVYNAGKYFTKCLDTLVNQTLREIEIILVLDCPTDGSDKTAKEYAANDSRIVIIENEKNLHIGLSRNRGLEAATGEYIGFSDHDDYRELDMYEKLYAEAKSDNLDIVLGVNYYFEKEISISQMPENLDNIELKKHILNDLIADGNDDALIPLATNVHPNLYKTSFIHENKLKFVDTKQFSPEDRIFQMHCLLLAQKISFTPQRYYYHILHRNSAVNDLNYKSVATRANGKNLIYNTLIATGNYEEYKEFFLQSVKKEFTECMLNTLLITKNISEFFHEKTFLKTFPFCSEAFKRSRYSLKRYGIGGRLSRTAVHWSMKI